MLLVSAMQCSLTVQLALRCSEIEWTKGQRNMSRFFLSKTLTSALLDILGGTAKSFWKARSLFLKVLETEEDIQLDGEDDFARLVW